jgi:8-oxo-dGTP pyrophosphatase MutT (NUDIX family)
MENMSYDLFHVTQGAIIKNSDGAVLILGLDDGHWILPGGHVDKGENWEEAFRRELKEELGLEDFKIKKLVDITSWLTKKSEQNIYALTFLVEARDFKEPKLSAEHVEYAWVTLENIDSYDFLDEIVKNRVRKGLEEKSLL